jgi:hypothetical protein
VRRFFLFGTGLIVAGFYLAGCSSLQTQSELTKARDGAQKAHRSLSAKAGSQHFCILGIRAGADGRVLHVGTHGLAAGILPGDLIVAVDGNPIRNWTDEKLKLRKRAPGELVSLLVRRNGSQLMIQAPCLDIAGTVAAVAEALGEAANGNWLACSEKMEQMQNEYGPSPTAQNILVDCYKYFLMSEGKIVDDAFAAALAKLAVLNIEEASWSLRSLQRLRGDVLAQIDWLRRNNFPTAAEQLEQKYNAALAQLTEPEGLESESRAAP